MAAGGAMMTMPLLRLLVVVITALLTRTSSAAASIDGFLSAGIGEFLFGGSTNEDDFMQTRHRELL